MTRVQRDVTKTTSQRKVEIIDRFNRHWSIRCNDSHPLPFEDRKLSPSCRYNRSNDRWIGRIGSAANENSEYRVKSAAGAEIR